MLDLVYLHFSDFSLGDGLVSGFDMLPSTTGFSSGGYTGALTYDYPLEAPPGLGGMNPKLSLNYSSNVPDNVAMNTDYNDSKVQAGVVGYGWEIGGVSYIARVQTPDHHDVEYYTMVIDGGDRRSTRGYCWRTDANDNGLSH